MIARVSDLVSVWSLVSGPVYRCWVFQIWTLYSYANLDPSVHDYHALWGPIGVFHLGVSICSEGNSRRKIGRAAMS